VNSEKSRWWRELSIIASTADDGPELTLEALGRLQDRPDLYSPGEERFWTDPHIAEQMLAAHLGPGNGAASRRPETIDREVEATGFLTWDVARVCTAPGSRAGVCR